MMPVKNFFVTVSLNLQRSIKVLQELSIKGDGA
jgi:hypothetical protein